MPRMLSSVRRPLRTLLLATSLLAPTFAVTTLHVAPVSATTVLCSGYTACSSGIFTTHGYAGASGRSYWSMYAGHNCTNYVAYVMIKLGVPQPAGLKNGHGNATNWGPAFSAAGYQLSNTAKPGDIAWWRGNGSSGHVAYVERVDSSGIAISEDAWRGNFDWSRLSTYGAPTAYIHIKSAK